MSSAPPPEIPGVSLLLAPFCSAPVVSFYAALDRTPDFASKSLDSLLGDLPPEPRWHGKACVADETEKPRLTAAFRGWAGRRRKALRKRMPVRIADDYAAWVFTSE
jgi:hypothetical protein